MGKVVKYCAKCEESFSEKFSFCPNCASEMTAYEMNPLMAETKMPESVKVFEPVAEEIIVEKIETKPLEAAVVASQIEPEPPAFLSQAADDDILEFAADDEIEAEPVTIPSVIAAPIVEESITIPSVIVAPVITEQFSVPVVAKSQPEPIPVVPAPIVIPAVAATNVEDYQRTYQSQAETANFASQASNNQNYEPKSNKQVADDGFYNITLVEPKNSGTRNMLLLGAAFLILTVSFGSVIGSIFNSDAYVGSLDDDLTRIVSVVEDVPIEEVEPPKVIKEKKGGGGGGGGNEAETPTSRGRLANQEKEPQIPPSVTMDQVTNPELVLRPATKGDRKEKPTEEKYGDPNSKFDAASDGTGSGGGQGSGRGRGQGGGQGDGAGNGIGSGNGNGNGNGNGDGTGDGRGNDRDRVKDEPPPIKVPPAGPSTALNITAKPQPKYTDAARQNQVQGTVTLRVTFMANGSIGSISPVNGLPNGLTEQAIAAARSIRFQPQLKNGVAQTVIKTLQYNFTLY